MPDEALPGEERRAKARTLAPDVPSPRRQGQLDKTGRLPVEV